MSEELVPKSGDSVAVIPGTGEVVDLTDPLAVAEALGNLRDFERMTYEWKQMMTRIVVEHGRTTGSLTIELPDGSKAEISDRPRVTYDAEAIEEELRAAGMPEESIAKIIKEEVTHTVKAVEAKKAARANPVYEEIIERHRTEEPSNPSVTIRRK